MITHILISINVIVFFIMILVGGNAVITNPSTDILLQFGASYSQLIFDYGQFWRLLTSNYLHIGLAHLLFNMWCLYSIGLELEEFMGSFLFIVTYTLSGIFGSLVSCLYYMSIGHNTVSAGASGAIFGIAGALVVVAVYIGSKYNRSQFNYDYSSLLFFIGFNIVYGLKVPGIDNGAHLGGLLFGIIMGLFYIFIKEIE
jgi:rhomboid protease GluP